MRLRISSLLLFGFVALFSGPPSLAADDEANKKELEKLKGTWQVVKPDGKVDDTWLSIQKDKVAFLKDNNKKEMASIKLKLDAAKKELDFPGEDGRVILALYELKDDTLMLCILTKDRATKQRPQKFGESDGQMVLKFVRDKK